MKLPNDEPSYNDLTRLIEVFSGDKDLMNWLRSLQNLNEDARYSHLKSMADGLRTTRERPELIAVVESLMSPRFFKAAVKTVQSLDH